MCALCSVARLIRAQAKSNLISDLARQHSNDDSKNGDADDAKVQRSWLRLGCDQRRDGGGDRAEMTAATADEMATLSDRKLGMSSRKQGV